VTIRGDPWQKDPWRSVAKGSVEIRGKGSVEIRGKGSVEIRGSGLARLSSG
jgi:hypothetical protein